ncbi:MAG: SirB2 family protein [Cytophagales bacterium]
MGKGILHLHITVVLVFIAFYAYKVFLLVSGKNEALAKLREKKMIDIGLGVLILATGGYLFSVYPKETWIVVKLVCVVALIPMGIVAMKKENKALAILTLVGFLYFVGVSFSRSLTLTPNKIEVKENTDAEEQVMNDSENEIARGKAVYESACTTCHGADGKLMQAGAKDLSVSALTMDEKVSMITKGKGLMQAFEGRLSEADIKAVASYTETLKK